MLLLLFVVELVLLMFKRSILGGSLVQWLKLSAWKVGDRGFEPHSDLQVYKKQNDLFPLARNDSILWGTSVRGSVLGLRPPGLEFRIMSLKE